MSEVEDDAKTEISASLVILAPWPEVEKVLSVVGVVPDYTWRQGDAAGQSLIKQSQDGCRILSTLPTSCSLSEHIEDILRRISPDLKNLLISAERSVKLAASVNIFGYDRPPFQVGVASVKKLAELGASIDVDIYTFPIENADNSVHATVQK